jgi:4-amino-4-deoxy-L-arabinose transferase-like glycosyltransferase
VEQHPVVVDAGRRLDRRVFAVAGAVSAVLLGFAGGYGYHRDELYFIACGRHLAWGYADQGPVTPLIARAMTALAPDSLVVLRIPPALAAGATVLVTALIAREIGGARLAQLIAAATAAVASIVLVTGHLLSTSTFDLLVWTLLGWLVIRAVLRRADRLWLLVGLVLGVGLLNKPLPAFFAVALLVGVAVGGPRRLLRSPWVWAGAVLALVLWAPWLAWQADHGWPQLDVSRSIASGGSTSSQPWWAVLPFQLLLVSPLLAPVWIAGLVTMFRRRELRFLGWAWVVLAVAFMATGGKPYYLGGMLPLLVGAGAPAVDAWLTGGRARGRWLGTAIAVSAVICGIIALPVLPRAALGPVLAANPDVGETVGWPGFVRTVAAVDHSLGSPAVVFTQNYGEAGAVDRYGPALGLPPAVSGHNAFGYWGHPAGAAGPVIVLGYDPAQAARWFAGCRVAARIDTGIDNDEDGGSVLACTAPRTSWDRLWPQLRHLG